MAKPSFWNSARRQGYNYDFQTHEYVPYQTSTEYLSHSQYAEGVNNHNNRPCSNYRFTSTLHEWVNVCTRYGYDGQKLIPVFISDGPSEFQSFYPGLKTIQSGSLNEAQSKIFGQSLNLAMSAKDIVDANKMASDYFGRVSKAAPYLRKKQFGKALKAFFGTKSKSLAAANSWLEFQFGVMPTIHAVQDAYNHASASIKASRGRLLRLRSASRTLRIQEPPPPEEGWKQVPVNFEQSRYVCYRYLSKQDFLQNMARFNVVEVAWDATPWSFLIDWFVPVGDYLSQFGSITTFTTDGCDSIKQEHEQYGTAIWLDNDADGHQVQSFSSHYVSFERRVNRTLSLNMSLSEMIERSKLNLSCKRTVTAFALARQRVGRK